MQCPKCGGTERVELARGYFECRTRIVLGASVAEQRGHSVPAPQYGLCCNRYQEATPSFAPPVCSCGCGLYAVGECAKCGLPLAGAHLGKSLPLYCASCRAVVEEESGRRAASVSAAEAERNAEVAKLADVRLRQMTHPIERLLAAIHSCETVSLDSVPLVILRPSILAMFTGLNPDLARMPVAGEPNSSGPRVMELFDSEKALESFGRWVSAQLHLRGIEPNAHVRDRKPVTRMFGTKYEPAWVKAWSFGEAGMDFSSDETSATEFFVSPRYDEGGEYYGEVIGTGANFFILPESDYEGLYYRGEVTPIGAYFIADLLGIGHPSDPSPPPPVKAACERSFHGL